MRKLSSADLEKRALRTISAAGKPGLVLLSRLNKNHFATPAGRAAFNRMHLILTKRGITLTWRNLCEDPSIPEDVRSSLRSFTQKPCNNMNSVNGLWDALENFRRIRALNDLSRSISMALQEEGVETESLVDSVTKSLSSLSTHGATVKINHIGKNDNSLPMIRQMMRDQKKRFIPTGFKTYDSVNHGAPKGALMMVGAPSGNFKSLMVQTLVRNFALSGAKVCLAPLEMDNMSIMQREMSSITQIPLTSLLNPTEKLSANQRKKVVKEFKKLSREIRNAGGQLTLFSSEEDLTIESLLTYCKPYGYHVVVVDYVGLLAGTDGDDQVKALGRVARISKIWAGANQALVILAAQMSDDGLVRYSRAMNEHASMFWHWKATPESRDLQTIRVHQSKARQADPFSFNLFCDPSTMTIRDHTPEELKRIGSGGGEKKDREAFSKYSKKGSKDKDKDEGYFETI